MKNWLKYLFVFYILLCSTGFAMAQSCTHKLELYDLYGDGWEGASVNLEVNGAIIINNATVDDVNSDAYGASKIIEFQAQTGDNISLDNWVSGTTDSEIVWAIKDGDGNIINSGEYGDGLTNVSAYCAPCEVLVHNEDFQTSVSNDWSSTLTTTAANNSTILGPFGYNDIVNLDLNSLPAHNSLKIEFELYIRGSMDGNHTNYGPDTWELELDNSNVISTNFRNTEGTAAGNNSQIYPGIPYTSASGVANSPNYGGYTGSTVANHGSNFATRYAMYEIKKTIAHTSSTAIFDFQSFFSNTSLTNESWALDNVKVYILDTEGCTDPTACNYDATACNDDGSCLTVYGCTDPTACNYNPGATCDDGSCTISGCMDPTACNYNPGASCDDGSCLTVYGCTDPTACNYNPGASCDDGSCILPDGCTDPLACNYDANAVCDDGSCATGGVTIDTTNLQHIDCPNGGSVGGASILLSDYTNHSWHNITNGQIYGNNIVTSVTNLDAGFYVVTASIPSNTLCDPIIYSDTFEIIEAEPIFNYSPTQSCSSDSNVTVSTSMGIAIPGVIYTYQWDNNLEVSLPDNLTNQWGGVHTYEIFADGIGCGIENIGISQQAPMNLATSVINALTCTLQGSATVVITGVGSSGLDTYCDSEPQFNNYTTIDNVLLVGNTTTISNNTFSIPDKYTDYTSLSADLDPGSSYNLNIDLGSESTTTYLVNIANVYIDWNIDGVFDAVSELVGQVGPTQSPSSHTISINVPVGAIPGQSRMRIVAQDVENQPTNQALPCDYQTAYFGSTEDYTIQVNGSVAAPVTYLWDDPLAQTTATANLGAGTYTVTITDANGCTATDTAIVTGLVFGCTDSTATNYNDLADCDDESCIADVLGCTDSLALNFDSLATIDDSSCIFLSDKVDLFFSEYGEGSSNNKYFEVYNPTGDTVDLSNYAYPMLNNSNFTNGPGIYQFWRNFSLGAEILPNDVFVVAHTSADGLILVQADMIVSGSTALSNGNDGMALIYGIEPSSPTTPNNGSYVILDWVGDWDGGPTNGWDVAGVNNATKDHTLVRKCSVTEGNPNSFISLTGSAGTDSLSSEWIVFDPTYWTNIGEHYFPCLTGCTDPTACNYDSTAITDDASCTYLILQTTVVDSTCDSNYAFVIATAGILDTVPPNTYCTPTYDYDILNITSVKLVGEGDSILNPTGNGTYDDFTSLYTTLTPNQTYNIDIELLYNQPFLVVIDIFIDWNIDGDFTDPGESILNTATLVANTPHLFTTTISVPASATLGATRMRLGLNALGLSDNPCFVTIASNTFGATEDYTLIINDAVLATPLIYLWSNGETDSIIYSLSADTFTVTVTDNSGCSATDTVIVGASVPISVTADSNQTICYGGTPNDLTAIGTGTGTGSYSWIPQSAFTNHNLQNPNFNPSGINSTSVFTVSFTDSNGCTATDSVTITVNPIPPRPNITASPDPACEGDTITLTAVSAICGPASPTPCYEVEVEITTDINGSEISWDITDNTGAVLASGGPYANGVVSTYTITACLPSGVQLYFNWYDSGGDGWNDGANQGGYIVMQSSATITSFNPSSGTSGTTSLGAVSSSTTLICTSPLMSNEYKFQYRFPTITGTWVDLTFPVWDSNNPVIYGPVSNDIDFRVKIREGSGCTASPFGGPTNQGITVPVNPLPLSGPIYHN